MMHTYTCLSFSPLLWLTMCCLLFGVPPCAVQFNAPAAPALPDFSKPPGSRTATSSSSGSGAAASPTVSRLQAGSAPRASCLLAQIRAGKNLNKIDIEAIKRDRQQNVRSARKSMALLSSLQETLRHALAERQEDMNLYGEDEDEDDGFWE
jgi:hypothetical protein